MQQELTAVSKCLKTFETRLLSQREYNKACDQESWSTKWQACPKAAYRFWDNLCTNNRGAQSCYGNPWRGEGVAPQRAYPHSWKHQGAWAAQPCFHLWETCQWQQLKCFKLPSIKGNPALWALPIAQRDEEISSPFLLHSCHHGRDPRPPSPSSKVQNSPEKWTQGAADKAPFWCSFQLRRAINGGSFTWISPQGAGMLP